MRNAMAMRVAIVLVIAPCMAGASAAEQAWPWRPLRIIVPQSPGGQTDFTARLIAPPLSERLGQPVVVDNRSGAGSMLGTDLVAKAPPDGYTLLFTPSSFTIIASIYKDVPFDPLRDFVPVTMLTSYANLVVVPPSIPVATIREFIAMAKAKPGTLNYGSAGNGTATQLGVELLKSMAGMDIVHVPFKGGGPALSAVLSAQVQFYFAPLGTSVPLVRSGRLRALAVTSAKRLAAMPEVPTVAESGVPGFVQMGWNGIAAPAHTPPAVVARLLKELDHVLKLPSLRERFAADGMETNEVSSAAFAATIKAEVAKWAKVIRDTGAKAY